MKYLLSLCIAAALVSGCGKKGDAPPPPEASATATPSAPPVAEPAAAGPVTLELTPAQGSALTGTLQLSPDASGVQVVGTVNGLKPNAEFGFHIHEKGDCSAPDFSSAGAHFNPANAQHGNPQSGAHHAGDMLNAKSDAEGNAQVETHADGVTLGDGGPTDVLGKAVVLHEKADDYKTQPSGDSGARIACGVIAAPGI